MPSESRTIDLGDERPRGVDRFLTERRSIDRIDADGSCQAAVDETDTESAWLVAWCAHYTSRSRLAHRNATIAAQFFEEIGVFRRAAEMWLLAALSVAATDITTALEHVTRAEQLIRWANLRPTGPIDDPYAADLPYLEGLLAVRGFEVARDKPFSPETLLARAADEARSVRAHAFRAHALRALARAELDAGRVDESMKALSVAVTVDQRLENTSGLLASIEVAALLAERLGVPEVREWSRGDGFQLDDEILAGRPDFSPAMRLRTTDAGRRRLATMIQAYRRSPDVGLRPDRDLVAVLLDPETLRYTRGRSWEFSMRAGLLLRDAGQSELSRRYLESSVETIEMTRTSIPDASLRQRFFRGKRVAYESLVEHYVGIESGGRASQDIAQALAVANATKARGLLDLLDGSIEPEESLADTTRWEPATTPRSRSEVLQSHLRKWIGRTSRVVGPVRPFDGLDSTESDALFVEYLIGPRAGFVFVVDGGETHVRRLPGAIAMRPRIDAFLSAVRDPKLGEHHVRATAERLYVDLIGPIQDLLVGQSSIIIAPDEAIAEVPFAALARPSDDADIDWFVRSHAIAYVPSLAVARRLSERPGSTYSGSILVGDPDLDRPAVALAALAQSPADVAFERLPQFFPALPGARQEVAAIQGAVPTPRRLLQGASGTESAVLSSAAKPPEVLHIAAHGLADGADSAVAVYQPAILLSRDPDSPRDGLLTLEEIIVARPRARLVTLSGCATGVGWRTLGDGAFGLAGAFLFAGSERVVASGWELEDQAARRTMTAFYRRRSEGTAQALRLAQLEQSKRRHPFYWASWRIYGADANEKEGERQ